MKGHQITHRQKNTLVLFFGINMSRPEAFVARDGDN